MPMSFPSLAIKCKHVAPSLKEECPTLPRVMSKGNLIGDWSTILNNRINWLHIVCQSIEHWGDGGYKRHVDLATDL
jgi:hypothetical protein